MRPCSPPNRRTVRSLSASSCCIDLLTLDSSMHGQLFAVMLQSAYVISEKRSRNELMCNP